MRHTALLVRLAGLTARCFSKRNQTQHPHSTAVVASICIVSAAGKQDKERHVTPKLGGEKLGESITVGATAGCPSLPYVSTRRSSKGLPRRNNQLDAMQTEQLLNAQRQKNSSDNGWCLNLKDTV